MCPGPDPKKTCPNCGADKPLNEFPPDADTVGGHGDTCLACTKRTCSDCGTEKLVEHFRRDPRMKSGYKTKCKDCVKESDASKPTLPSGSRRICKGACGEDKPIEDYANDKSHPGGYRSKCKACEEGTEAKRVHNKPAKIPMPPGTLKTCKGTCGASKPIEDFQSPAPGYCLNSCKACNAPQPGSRKTCKGPRAADKPIEDFRKNGSGGYRPKCKDCMTDQGRSKPKESIPGKIVMPSGRRMKFTLTGSGTAGLATAQHDEDEGDDVHSTNPRLAELQRLYSNLFRRPTGANKRYARGVNYWPLSRKEILSRHTELGSSSLSKYDLVRALQRDEVAHGLLPIPRPVHSPYHFLSRDSLEILARSRAFTAFMNAENSRLASEFGEDRALSTQVGDGDAAMLDVDAAQPNINDLAAATDEAHSERLSVSAIDPRLRDFAKKSQSSATRLENDDVHDKHDHSSEVDVWGPMDDASQQALASMLVDDLTLSLGLDTHTLEAYKRCSTTLNQPSQLRRVRIGEVVGITGTQTAFDLLYPLLHEGRIMPQATSSRGLLCGVFALERSLRFMQHRLHESSPDLWQVDPSVRFFEPPLITYADMMRVLFSDWDPLRQYDSGDSATPTPAYDAYIRRQYSSLLTDEADAVLFNHAYTAMTRVMNMDALQLQAILTLLYNDGNNPDMPIHYQLGVIRSGYWRGVPGPGPAREEAVPANVRFINDFDPSHHRQAALFVHNRVALGNEEYSHFEGMDDSGGSGYHEVLSWGMRVDADEYHAEGPQGNDDLSEEPENHKSQRLARNERNDRRAAAKREHIGCIPCREQNRQCTGDVWQVPCPQCQDTELYDGGDAPNCTWDDHLRPMQFITSEATPQQREVMMQRWNTPFIPDNITAGFVAVDPVPVVRHFFVIALARTSSARDPATMAAIAADQQITLHHYDNMLNAGPNANIQVVHFPVGQRPTDENGGYLHMRKARFTIARHGTRAVPTTAGNVNNPAVIRLVALFHEVFAYQQPVPASHPYEIHMLLNWFAGLSVGIPAWGSLVPWEGFYAWVSDLDIQNHTALAERIFIILLAEPHVVDGVLPHSLEFPNRTARWPRHRGKHMHKRRLVDLLTRNEDLRAAALGYAPLPQRWPAADEHDLDVMLEAMFNEARYRSGQLDALTAPSLQDVAARNTGRNAPLR